MGKNMYDVIIIGGGIMGSSLAYNLMRADNRLKVLVVERDPTYAQASTTLSMTNARIQFSLQQNIQASQYAFDVFESFEDDMMVDGEKPAISYRREGNLFLFDEHGQDAAREAFDLQKSLDCPIEWWSTDRIRERYPLYDPMGYAGATFGPADGHFDAYAVLMAYKKKARELGASLSARRGRSHRDPRRPGGTRKPDFRGCFPGRRHCQLRRRLGSSNCGNSRHQPAGGPGEASGLYPGHDRETRGAAAADRAAFGPLFPHGNRRPYSVGKIHG